MDLSIWVLLICTCIGLLVLIFWIELVAVVVIAFWVLAEYVTMVARVFNVLLVCQSLDSYVAQLYSLPTVVYVSRPFFFTGCPPDMC